MTAEEIRFIIELSGLSGREFGQVVGVEEMTVNRWEAGETTPGTLHEGRIRAVRRAVIGMSEAEHRSYYRSIIDPKDIGRAFTGKGGLYANQEAQEMAERLLDEMEGVERVDPVAWLRARVDEMVNAECGMRIE